tara:strand:- start:1142 stop:1351 length:210 start_codon:yes stop_codon:yes gene_type:complete
MSKELKDSTQKWMQKPTESRATQKEHKGCNFSKSQSINKKESKHRKKITKVSTLQKKNICHFWTNSVVM